MSFTQEGFVSEIASHHVFSGDCCVYSPNILLISHGRKAHLFSLLFRMYMYLAPLTWRNGGYGVVVVFRFPLIQKLLLIPQTHRQMAGDQSLKLEVYFSIFLPGPLKMYGMVAVIIESRTVLLLTFVKVHGRPNVDLPIQHVPDLIHASRPLNGGIDWRVHFNKLGHRHYYKPPVLAGSRSGTRGARSQPTSIKNLTLR